jgi:excisionase family DNA binding protein
MADLLTTNEVQDLLLVDRTTIYRMIESGRLPALRVGKQWRFPKAEIERWLRAQAAPAMSPAALVTPATSAVEPASNGAQKVALTAVATSLNLRDLLPLECAQALQDAFAGLLGVMIVVTDMAGQPVTQVSNPCGLYSVLIHDAETLASCVVHWQQMAGAVTLEPRFMPSDMGLLCARGLIRMGNELKGMVFFGGIAPDDWPPTEAQAAAIAGHFGLMTEVVNANIEAVYRLDRAGRDRVLNFVQRIADIFSHVLEDRKALYGRLRAIASLTSL